MTGARVVLILAALSPFCFAAIVLIGAVRRLRSRGEEAGTPEERDGEMAVARASELDHFAVWEAECSKLQRLADKLGSRS